MESMTLDAFFKTIIPETNEAGTQLYLETNFHKIAFATKNCFTANYLNENSCKTTINFDYNQKIFSFSCTCDSSQEICAHIVALSMAVKNDEIA